MYFSKIAVTNIARAAGAFEVLLEKSGGLMGKSLLKLLLSIAVGLTWMTMALGKDSNQRTSETQKQPTSAVGSSQNPNSSAERVDSLLWLWAWAGGGQRALADGFEISYSVGQPIGICGVSDAIYSTSLQYHQIGGGFWNLAPGVDACNIAARGDNNCDAKTTSADIIFAVNFVFKGACTLCPWAYAGDCNCDGVINSADLICLVNYVFKGGEVPCDACTSPSFYVALCQCGH